MVCVSFHFVGSKCRVIARENNRPEDTPPNPLNTTFDYSSPEISCHKHSLRPILTDYIYRKIHKKAKRQILRSEFAPYEKTISQIF